MHASPDSAAVCALPAADCGQVPYVDLIQCHDIEFGSLDQVRGHAIRVAAAHVVQQHQTNGRSQQARQAFPLPVRARAVARRRRSFARRCRHWRRSRRRGWCDSSASPGCRSRRCSMCSTACQWVSGADGLCRAVRAPCIGGGSCTRSQAVSERARHHAALLAGLLSTRVVLCAGSVDVVLSYCHYCLNDTALAEHIPYLQEKQARGDAGAQQGSSSARMHARRAAWMQAHSGASRLPARPGSSPQPPLSRAACCCNESTLLHAGRHHQRQPTVHGPADAARAARVAPGAAGSQGGVCCSGSLLR